MTDEESNEYQEAFSERRFSQKLSRYAKAAGREVVEKSLLLYYTLRDDKAPAWARATITGALGYFIVPLDAIADFTPAVGYADDLDVLREPRLSSDAVRERPQDSRKAKASQVSCRQGLIVENRYFVGSVLILL